MSAMSPSNMSRFWLGLAAGALVASGGLVVWLATADAMSMKAALRILTPRTLELTFLLMAAGLAVNYRGIVDSLPPRRALPWIVLVLALAAVVLLPPRTHRIYYDEDIYQNVAQNILWEGRAQMCNEGFVTAGTFTCEAWEYNKEPNAFPFLLSVTFRGSGVEEWAAHWLNHAVFALGAVAVYWVAGLLFGKTSVAFGAALVYVLTPQNLLWGSTIAVEPSAATFGAVGIGAWIYFCKRPSWRSAVFGASSLAFASQFRPESGLILATAAVAMLLIAPGLLRRREAYGGAFLLFVLLVPHFAHLWAVRNEDWGSAEAKFSRDYVRHNLKTNASYYVEGADFPPYFTLAALVGLFYSRRRVEVAIMVVWFVLFFGIFIPFYAGSYRYGADVRFAFVSAAPLSILAGAGLALACEWLGRRFSHGSWLQWVPYLLALYAFTHHIPLVRAVGVEAWQARADHDTALAMVEELPEDAVMLTHNPGMIQVMGLSAVQTSLATYQPARVDHFFDRFPGGVYFHYNFWCNVDDEVQNEFCADVLAHYGAQVVMEESAGFYRYVLYRLLPRSKPPPPLPGPNPVPE